MEKSSTKSVTIQGLHRGGGWRECAEVGSLLTWRVNALWGPGMGSFSAGAGTDKHTASFSAVRAAGDCKSRNVSEPRPSTVGQRQVKVSHPVARPGQFPRHFRLLCEGESADECYKDPHFPDELTPGNCSRTLNGLRTDVGACTSMPTVPTLMRHTVAFTASLITLGHVRILALSS